MDNKTNPFYELMVNCDLADTGINSLRKQIKGLYLVLCYLPIPVIGLTRNAKIITLCCCFQIESNKIGTDVLEVSDIDLNRDTSAILRYILVVLMKFIGKH